MRLTGYVIRDLGLDPKRFPPRGVHGHDQRGRTSSSTRRGRPPRRGDIFERKHADVYTEYQARLLQGRARWTSTTCCSTTVACSASTPTCSSTTAALPAHPRRRVPGHQPGPERDRPLLAGGHHNVCVVGDADQSVYRFRGADFRNILQFEDAFPDATTIVLDQNYRSTQTILDAANAVIANNPGRKPKKLWTDPGAGDRIVRYHAEDEGDEAQWVAAHDRAAARRRRHQLARDRRLLPHQRPEPRGRGGAHAHRRARTRSSAARASTTGARSRTRMAYLRAVVNPADEVSVKRVLNVPKRGVGDASVGRLDACARAHGRRASSRRCATPTRPASPARRVRGIDSFLDLLDELAPMAAPTAPADAAAGRARAPGYLAELEAEHTVEADGPAREPRRAGRRRPASSTRVDEFLEQVVAGRRHRRPRRDDDQVVLMTLHSAKGLEFPVGVPRRAPRRASSRTSAPLDRARRAGGGAPAGLRRHHPRP